MVSVEHYLGISELVCHLQRYSKVSLQAAKVWDTGHSLLEEVLQVHWKIIFNRY